MEEKKGAVLVIGYGNPYCHDDGVGLYIVNALRKHWGEQELGADDDGLDGVGHSRDGVVLHQLLPEIAPLIAKYQTVVFVDAHTGGIPDEVRVVTVEEEYGFHAVTHHMSPGMVLSLVHRARGGAPSGYLVSVKGDDFDFGFGLTEACRRRAETAVSKILDLIGRQTGATILKY